VRCSSSRLYWRKFCWQSGHHLGRLTDSCFESEQAVCVEEMYPSPIPKSTTRISPPTSFDARAQIEKQKPTTCQKVMGFETPSERNLFCDEHLLRLGRIAGLNPIHVHSARKRTCVELDFVYSCLPPVIHQERHLPAKNVIHRQADV